jgi:Spy/CpxP family protein refolding chaperone
MHPGFYGWWKSRQGGDCGEGCGHERGGGWHGGHGHTDPWQEARRWAGGPDGSAGGEFGVRRPLRFLAHKLELDEKQVGELARILNELKTERAQAEVDGRRTTAAFADAIGGAAFDEAKAGEGATLRVHSAEKLKNAVQQALRQIHAVLSDDQRQRLAYLIRTGVVTL